MPDKFSAFQAVSSPRRKYVQVLAYIEFIFVAQAVDAIEGQYQRQLTFSAFAKLSTCRKPANLASRFRCIINGADMTESFLPNSLYAIVVDRVTRVAGQGDVDLIKVALGPLLHDRAGLAERLAHLAPCPVTGRVTDTETKHCLGEHGDYWPKEVYGDVLLATVEAGL